MAQYTVITKDITTIEGNNKPEAVLVYCYIKSRENYKTHLVDNLTYEEISYHLGISLPTVKRIVPTLYKNPLLFKGYEHIEKDGKTYLIYEFHDTYEHFFYIDNSLLKRYEKILDIQYENQVKGLLLLLKANCLNGTNNYFFKRMSKNGINYAELSRLLNMDRDTIKKYLSIVLEEGLIKMIPNGLAIMDGNIYTYFYGQNYDDEFYKMLCYWCKQKNIYPPSKEDDKLSYLQAHYPIISNDIILLAKQNGIEPNDFLKMMVKEKNPLLNGFLPYQLHKRKIQPKDGYLTWKYLFKVLNLKLPSKPQHTNYTM